MKFLWLKKVTNKPRTRLKQKVRSGFEGHGPALMGRPWVTLTAWLLIWLTSLVLRTLNLPLVPDKLESGMISTVAVRSAISFERMMPIDTAAPARKSQVPAGTTLIRRGERITPQTLELLDVYDMALHTRAGQAQWLTRRLGDGLVLVSGLLATLLFLGLMSRFDNDYGRHVMLFWVMSLFTLIPAQWLLRVDRFHDFFIQGDVAFLLPLALAPLLSAILQGALPAAAICFWVSFSAAVLADYSLPVLIIGIVQGLVVVRWARQVRSRKVIFRLGLLAGLAGAACAMAFALVNYTFGEALLKNCLFSLASGMISALATLLLLPLLEMIFGITTDISLLELADMEHPLLKRLAIEAPGTYQHSLMVANLAQAGAEAVGGNALRTRICAYFHDIGKLVKPDYFAENIQFRENPHDDLTPRMSFLVIASHVKEGISLALKYNLPRPVLDAIEQHHGTGMVSYFYHKATRDQEAGAVKLRADDFRYPGPRPKEREAVVLSLADSIEAASRSLTKITPASIAGLVEDIVTERLRDGQLDDCPLTMAELSKLKRVFVFTLTNMLHGRISYPTDENRNKSATASDRDQPAGRPAPDAASDAGGRAD
ncbi:MAG: HDIG domain-containing protein [Lentisphaerae bacterium]|nr:HDIG domain-containing protein [Lentisphaerota bacterium]